MSVMIAQGLTENSKLESVLRFWGMYKLLVGVLAATESLLGMLRGFNGVERGVWGPLTVAAAILLALDGLGQLFPRASRWLLVALAAIVPLAISIISEDWPVKIWMFAAAVAFAEWMFQEIKSAAGRTEVGALLCGVALAISLGNTTLMLFRVYWDEPQFWPLGQIFRFMFPIALPWTLILILIVHAARETIWGLKGQGNPGPEGQSRVDPRSAA
jgi:hypothetical protein